MKTNFVNNFKYEAEPCCVFLVARISGFIYSFYQNIVSQNLDSTWLVRVVIFWRVIFLVLLCHINCFQVKYVQFRSLLTKVSKKRKLL